MRYSIITYLCCLALQSSAATIDLRLEIKSGLLNLVSGAQIPYRVYTSDALFPMKSDLLIWNQADIVNLKVVNSDSIAHGFVLSNYIDMGTIVPGDSVTQSFTLNNTGVFRYYDPLSFPYNQYTGLAGIVHVKAINDTTPYFYWDVREHMTEWNDTIFQSYFPPLDTYEPDYFTINGQSNPAINMDTIARITGVAGAEFRLVIVNNGLSVHSMHFHGYHLTSLIDTKFQVGRVKDTFPVYPGEALMLSCIPDKGGEYPVHDHNLVAVTGGQMYANGMFTTMLIAP